MRENRAYAKSKVADVVVVSGRAQHCPLVCSQRVAGLHVTSFLVVVCVLFFCV